MHSRLNGQLFAEKPIYCVAPARVQSINESLFVGRHLLILEDCGKSTSSFLLLQRDLAHFSNPHEHPITVITTWKYDVKLLWLRQIFTTISNFTTTQSQPMGSFPSRWLVMQCFLSTATHGQHLPLKSLCGSLTTAQGVSVGNPDQRVTPID